MKKNQRIVKISCLVHILNRIFPNVRQGREKRILSFIHIFTEGSHETPSPGYVTIGYLISCSNFKKSKSSNFDLERHFSHPPIPTLQSNVYELNLLRFSNIYCSIRMHQTKEQEENNQATLATAPQRLI